MGASELFVIHVIIPCKGHIYAAVRLDPGQEKELNVSYCTREERAIQRQFIPPPLSALGHAPTSYQFFFETNFHQMIFKRTAKWRKSPNPFSSLGNLKHLLLNSSLVIVNFGDDRLFIHKFTDQFSVNMVQHGSNFWTLYCDSVHAGENDGIDFICKKIYRLHFWSLATSFAKY